MSCRRGFDDVCGGWVTREYQAARAAANAANRSLRAQTPGMNPTLEVHEVQPVKFGGSPTSPANKAILTESMHDAYSAWWSRLLRDLIGVP